MTQVRSWFRVNSLQWSNVPFVAAIAGGTALYLSTPRAAFLDGRFVYANWDMEQVESIKDEIVSKDLLVSRVQYGDRMDKAFML